MSINYESIGERVKEKRLLNKLSQEELAEQVDRSKQHIGNIERAKTKVSLETLVDIANALHCTADELICGSVAESRVIYNNEISATVETFSDEQIRVLPEFLRYYGYLWKTIEQCKDKEK